MITIANIFGAYYSRTFALAFWLGVRWFALAEIPRNYKTFREGIIHTHKTKRVELLGRKAGVEGLIAHDARHYWATYEARNKTSIDRLMDAGGWNSGAMPLRYIEAARIANEGTARVKALNP